MLPINSANQRLDQLLEDSPQTRSPGLLDQTDMGTDRQGPAHGHSEDADTRTPEKHHVEEQGSARARKLFIPEIPTCTLSPVHTPSQYNGFI